MAEGLYHGLVIVGLGFCDEDFSSDHLYRLYLSASDSQSLEGRVMAEAGRAELRPAVLHLGLERDALEVERQDSSSTGARPAPWDRLASSHN